MQIAERTRDKATDTMMQGNENENGDEADKCE